MHVPARDRVPPDHPGIVECGVFGLYRGAEIADLFDPEAIGRIEDGEAAAQQLAMRDQRGLDVGRPDAGDDADRDVVDVLERGDPGALAAAAVEADEVVEL